MHPRASRLFFYYPSTLLKGEPVLFLMGKYRKSQWLPPEKLEAIRLRRLKRLLHYAFKNSKYYRGLYKKSGVDVTDIQFLSDIQKLPTITKQDLISNGSEMLVGRKQWLSSIKTTGGSTGEPVTLYKNPMALARERCVTWRSYEWAGVSIGDPQLRFWGVPHSRVGATKAGLIDIVANRQRVSAFNLTPERLQKYYTDALSFRPSYVYGYVSVIEELAKHILDKKLSPLPSVRAVITTAEILTPAARGIIESAFKVRVFNEYGCGEVGSIAHECEQGSMHLMADNLLVEVDSSSGQSGEIIVTDLFNFATPLIRYRLGDYATLSKVACDCGRTLPVIQAIHGRAYDILKAPSGRLIHPEAIIYIIEELQAKTRAFTQFQAVQTAVDNINIYIIPSVNWCDSVRHSLLMNLKSKIDPDIKYKVSVVSLLERESSGKMRLVKRLHFD